jgi:hypothetical protein
MLPSAYSSVLKADIAFFSNVGKSTRLYTGNHVQEVLSVTAHRIADGKFFFENIK